MKNSLINQAVINYNNNNFSLIEPDEQVREFYHVLEANKVIKLMKNGKIKKINKTKVYIGYLEVKGHFGFIYTEEDSYYVHKTDNYFSGDFVVAIENEGFTGRNIELKILGLISRDEQELICKVDKDKNISTLESRYEKYTISLDKEDFVKINERQVIKVKITNVNNKQLQAKLVKVIADENDPDIQMKIVLEMYDISTSFSQQTMEQVESINEPTSNELENRVDLTKHLFMTIDGADSKDLDDAVCLQKENDNYRLYVSIADVSHYVTENSSLDIDAYEKSTSVYFVDRVVPMLPKKLSNGICSLNPFVNRLTLTCEMLIDKTGKVIDSKIYKSYINSKYRLTYDQVNEVIHENKCDDTIKELFGVIKEMDKLRAILNRKRLNRGAFNLEDKDAKFTVDKDGNIIDIKPVIRKNGEKLIEEFMIVANETVAQTIYFMELPFIYRVHDQPNIKKLRDVLKAFSLFNITIKGDVHEFKPQMFKQALDQVDDQITKRVLSDIIVRSLSKASYQEKNIGHFGLASENYTHFTSPIRRYPDLIVHRKLNQYLFNHNLNFNNKDIDKLAEIGRYTSEKEIKAIKASQKIEDQKKAAYMTQFIGTKYRGVVAAIVEYGFFVELENTVRGLIKFKNIKEFSKLNNGSKISFSNKTTLTLGDYVDVILRETDEQNGLVEFDLVNYTMKEQTKPIKKSYKDKKQINYNSKNRRRKKYSNKRGKNENRRPK